MSDHEHHHDPEHSHAPDSQMQDAGTQALAEALRSSFAIVKIVMVLMVVAFFCSGFFTVGPTQKAVILRFGKIVGGDKALLNPGWHWSFPYPIDEVKLISFSEQQSVQSTSGWYFTTPEQELSGEEIPAGAGLDPARDGYVITADRNIIHVRATLWYHIDDPIRYVFSFSNAPTTIQNALNESIFYVAARFKVDDALYNDQSGFREAVQQRAADLLEQAQLGIVIDNCQVVNIPPRQLKSEFDQVINSRENRNTTIYEAQGKANGIVLNAGAQAAGITNEAESSVIKYVTSVKADADTFTKYLPKYQANPNLFAQELFVPAVANVITNVEKMFLPRRADGKPTELRLQLNREPPQPKNAQ